MAANFPKLPGFVPTYPLEQQDFRKVSSVKQEQKRDVKNQQKAWFDLPRKEEVKEMDNSRAVHPAYMTTNQDNYKSVVGQDTG